ncbi:hypothetical protein BKP45_06365 [Anaerobacillus alkalidiazotrophicus]|uniref:Gram-positive cocci surface proteins LPxTG domain-containing protein n=1 Tax=Anaerobacillus alkalidiazotrophicus TaxID=472963 RepID=A0A1S2MBV5_9BACI|nr:hypothetical protein [Anaerobacillus alkalidiazotrophicus]OIJ22262.1 hypothetical protein BKP45_06365 [Anaerobacillus alkalidiazotrophicus]
MKKKMKILESIWFKGLLIGSCLTLITTSGVFANSDEPKTRELIEINEDVSTVRELPQDYNGYKSEELMNKHREIDHLLFGEKSGDFSDIGFKVTNTGPHEGKIEIGIIPFKESYAKHLYEIFGTDDIQVVEGIEAVTLDLPVSTMDEPVSNTDHIDAPTPEERAELSTRNTMELTEEAADIVADAASLTLSDTSNSNTSQLTIFAIIVASIVLLGGGISFRKFSTKAKR